MYPVDGRAPCVIGVARHTWHPDPLPDAPEPLDMWESIARAAANDARAQHDPLGRIDDLGLVHCQSRRYDAPSQRLADRLQLESGHRTESILAGTSPQRLVNAAAERMLRGETRVALIVGGEALATRAHLRRTGASAPWSVPHPHPPAFPIDLDEWFLPTEMAHGVLPAWLTFALMDQARAAARETGALAYRRELGTMLARCTTIAATNPDAWFREEHSAAKIITPTVGNRLVADPYTKLMTAFMDVDMAAGVLLATHDEAEALGVPVGQRVYLRGWAFARDATHVGARADLGRSEAMGVAARAALELAGAGVDDVDVFDLYSCFSSALGFATDALGLAPGDPRPPTLTGALPYHGGPSSNYMSHSIGHLVDRLRARPGELGLVSGIGMHMTKHVFACYSTEPGPVRPPDYLALQAEVERRQPDRVVANSAAGAARVVASTTVFHHDSSPAWVLAVCDLADGRRAYARSDAPEVLDAMAGDGWREREITLRAGPEGTNAFEVT